MGREWELSFRLGMRPWIAVAYSAPVAAASAVFLVYPIGQGSFSDGMPLGKFVAFYCINAVIFNVLNGKIPNFTSFFNMPARWAVRGSALSPTGGGGFDPKEPLEGAISSEDVQRATLKGLKSLENPVLRGSFSLFLTTQRMEELEIIATRAFIDIMGSAGTIANYPDAIIRTNHIKGGLRATLEKTPGVYVVQNTENGYCVTGQTTDFNNRFNQYPRVQRKKRAKIILIFLYILTLKALLNVMGNKIVVFVAMLYTLGLIHGAKPSR
jgi:hypothetical protein